MNFALALDEFDPARHQPHPPGYPLEVAAARAVRSLFPDPLTTLAMVSALAQAILVYPLFALFTALSGHRPVAWAATLLTLCCPVVWLTGARPMSDSLGLLMTVAALSALVRGPESPMRLIGGSFLAGLAPGARLQSLVLTAPLLARALLKSPKGRLAALAAGALGSALWLLPVVVASGGISAYTRAFGRTVSEAAAWEPLLRHLSLNGLVRALDAALLQPWGEKTLGFTVLALAALGFGSLLSHRRKSLVLGSISFGPYFLLHLFFQHVETTRYSLLYLPFVCWLAIEGAHALGSLAPRVRWVAPSVAASVITLSLFVALPALSTYSKSMSPVHAALDELSYVATPRDRFVLAGHHVFSRYYQGRPEGLRLLEAGAGGEVAALAEYWKSGGENEVLFLADPRRTDLENVAPGSRMSLAVWEWPRSLAPLLAGTRPATVALIALSPPSWFAGPGWLLSLESGPVSRLGSFVEREAFLRPEVETAFVLVAGEPGGPCEDVEVEIEADGASLGRRPCDAPFLLGAELPPARKRGWTRLVVRTERSGEPMEAPLVLRGLDYGVSSDPGLVCGAGFFYPEPDEGRRIFRWISDEALCLVHVPESGGHLRIEGVAPLEYLGTGVALEVIQQGSEPRSFALNARNFLVEMPLDRKNSLATLTLRTNRSFVPDRLQWNGDRRALSLRVYSIRVETGTPQDARLARTMGTERSRARLLSGRR